MNEIKQLTRRNIYPLEYFKSIKLEIEYPERITAFIYYIREHYDNYDFDNGDSLDKGIENLFSSIFTNVVRSYQTPLIFEEQLDNSKNVIRGGITKDIILYFMPEPTYELFEQHSFDGATNAFPREISISFRTNNKSNSDQAIQNEYLIHINKEDLRRCKTLKKLEL